MNAKAKTILVADDEQDILEIISYNLLKEGYTVYTARMEMKHWKKHV
jgi:two-component system alkaline phosphatase synthesis response regulator PhoP